jgi:hypothetical protein
VEELVTERPAGKTSVNATPVNAWFPEAVLLSVKVKVEVEPLLMETGEKDLEIVGAGIGTPQPVKVTLSMAKRELSFCAPVAEILKYVEPALVVNVVLPGELVKVAEEPLKTVFEVKFVPSELEERVTAATSQLALVSM